MAQTASRGTVQADTMSDTRARLLIQPPRVYSRVYYLSKSSLRFVATLSRISAVPSRSCAGGRLLRLDLVCSPLVSVPWKLTSPDLTRFAALGATIEAAAAAESRFVRPVLVRLAGFRSNGGSSMLPSLPFQRLWWQLIDPCSKVLTQAAGPSRSSRACLTDSVLSHSLPMPHVH